MEIPLINPLQSSTAAPFARIGVVGLGLIGGSIALAARQLWPSSLVIASDNKDVLETAMRLHVVDVAADDLVVLAEADIVILAAPIAQNIRVLAALDENVRQAAVVTDVGSTKRATVDAARVLPRRLRFVGGHPLAGAALGGLEHARADLFAGRPWVLTPAGDGDGDAIDKLSQFVRALGALPHIMDPAAHDRLLAYLSHLPQLAASALMQAIGEHVGRDGLALAGRGLVDTTRLASSPADIWRDIAATNADELGPALDALIETLMRLRDDLPAGEALESVFGDARRWRSLLKP